MSFDALGKPRVPTPLQGSECFHHSGKETDFTVGRFWQWGCSDVLSNALRGTVAEYIVASALRTHHGCREEWAPYDLVTETGIQVEVKSAAYLQSWPQDKPSRIQWSIAPSRFWYPETRKYAESPQRQADVYVFCLLDHKDKATVDPLDLDQWAFFVVPTQRLNEQVGEQATISLSALERLSPTRCKHNGLASAVHLAGRV